MFSPSLPGGVGSFGRDAGSKDDNKRSETFVLSLLVALELLGFVAAGVVELEAGGNDSRRVRGMDFVCCCDPSARVGDSGMIADADVGICTYCIVAAEPLDLLLENASSVCLETTPDDIVAGY